MKSIIIPVQSISDVITNSSSELFIIKNPKKKGEEITEFLQGVYKLLGQDIDEDMYIESANAQSIKDVSYQGYKCEKGDLLIWSQEENSIPYPIMDLIEGCEYLFDLPYGSIERHHLG